MLTDAALASLDLARLFLIRGDYDAVRNITRELVERFKEAGKLNAQLTAIAYLDEAAARQRLTPELFDTVRRFVAASTADQSRVFAPPVE